MKEHIYDDSTQDEDLSWEDDSYEDSVENALSEEDIDAFSYTDEEHTDEDDIQEQPAGKDKGKHQKSEEILSLEKEFLALYEEYIHPTKEYSECRVSWQLDDLCEKLMKLNRSWAYKTAQSYKQAGYDEADGDDALAVSIEYTYDLLRKDRATGNYCSYPIAHYLKISHYKTIDHYFRKLKLRHTISIDAPISGDDPRPVGEVLPGGIEEPFPGWGRSRQERDEKANRLKMMFLRELMDYPNDPPKPLALMYGNILFQLCKDYGGNDDLSMMAKSSTKVSSPEWAHQRMGRATLLQLGIESERIVQKCISKSLTWGTAFNQHMLERTADGSRRVWADIIYTKTYTEGNTSNWIESIMKSTINKCSRKMTGNPDLTEYAIETFGAKNTFRKALEKMEKEDRR